MTYDPDQLGHLVDDAPEAGLAPINYGKLTVSAHVLTWNRTPDGVATPERRDLKKGEELARGQTLELQFDIDIQEFNPGLQFSYSRNVSVQKTSPRMKTDWSEIVEPSLIAVFGKGWPKAVARNPYVEVEDVPNVMGKVSKTTQKPFGITKFLRVFPNAASCQKAREERFGTAAAPATDATPGVPPDSVIAQTANLIKGVGEAMARQMLDGHPFGDYDAEVLFNSAKAKLV